MHPRVLLHRLERLPGDAPVAMLLTSPRVRLWALAFDRRDSSGRPARHKWQGTRALPSAHLLEGRHGRLLHGHWWQRGTLFDRYRGASAGVSPRRSTSWQLAKVAAGQWQ